MANKFFGWLQKVFSPGSGGKTSDTKKGPTTTKKGPTVSNKPKGVSVHIGLNSVDPNHYKKKDGTGWDGALRACERDANDMAQIAKDNGFETQIILTKEATRQKIRDTFTAASQKLKAGDMFLVSYSGHGGQVPDYSGDEAEITKGDDVDETWCLFDGQILDDELNMLYGNFDKGVRILVFSDSCHSGTVTRVFGEEEEEDDPSLGAPRLMPDDEALQTYLENEDFYRDLGESMPTSEVNIAAPILLISGCQDEQLSRDGMINGRFTGNLKRVLKEGGFKNYKELHQKIVDKMPDDQTPNYLLLGNAPEFEGQRPFQI